MRLLKPQIKYIIYIMRKRETYLLLKKILSSAVIVLLGVATVVFGVLYMDATRIAFIEERRVLVTTLFSVAVSLLCLTAIIFQLYDKTFVYKLTVITLFLFALAALVLYLFKISGLWDKIDGVDDLREYVASYGAFTVPVFILLQFLQVTVLPIPGFIAIGAGVALFGPFYGSIYSIIGILSASIVAFFIGRVFGYKVASWLVGKESLKKGLKLVKGKDKIVLTFMFLFPFFPDDILCFVAGLSSMSTSYYLIMITITRTLNVVVSAYSINGSIIPYNTWWGLAIWIIIFALTALACAYVYKHGEKLEKRLKSLFKRKKDGKNHTSRRS